MKKQVIAALALAAATLFSGNALAQTKEGPWMVRVRAVNLQSVNTDSTDLGMGLSINDKTIPEIDISYFFTKNIAVELILTVPQEQNLYSNGAKIGTFNHLPPTVLAQYHFDAPGFKPYVGVGLNYTLFSGAELPPGVTIDRSSTGGALQVGADIPLSGNMYLNLDIKKVYLGTKVYVNGADHGTLSVDPLLVGVGLGWRF
jgi:outer membrane protein